METWKVSLRDDCEQNDVNKWNEIYHEDPQQYPGIKTLAEKTKGIT